MPDTPPRGEQVGFWDFLAKRYDFSARFCRVYPQMLARITKEVAGAEHVLDAATGTGLVAVAIAPHVGRVDAVDISDRMLGILRRKIERRTITNITPHHQSIYELDFADGTFDVVTVGNLLHNIAEPDRALGEVRRVLQPGGKLVLTSFCMGESRWGRLKSHLVRLVGCRIYQRFTLDTLQQYIESAGFEIRSAERIRGAAPLGFVVAATPDDPG